MYTFVYLGTSSLTAERCCWSVCGWKLWGPRICRKSGAARSWESRAHGDLRYRTTPTAANVNTRGQNRTRKKQERYRIRPDQRRRVYVNRKGEREGRTDTTVYVWKEGRKREKRKRGWRKKKPRWSVRIWGRSRRREGREWNPPIDFPLRGDWSIWFVCVWVRWVWREESTSTTMVFLEW